MEYMRNTDASAVRYALLETNGSREDGGEKRERDDEERDNRHHVGVVSGARALRAGRVSGRWSE